MSFQDKLDAFEENLGKKDLNKIKQGFIDNINSATSTSDIQTIVNQINNDKKGIVAELLLYSTPADVPNKDFHIYQEKRGQIINALDITDPLYIKQLSLGPSHIAAAPYRGGKRRNTRSRNRKSKKTRKSRKNRRKSKRRSRR
jgi:hypothetical protein